MQSRGVRDNSERGVTLIELVVVMAIIAIMALFMTPSLGEWVQNYRIKQAARNVASDLQSAKMQAISMHRYCTVAFNANGYVIFPDYDNDMVLDTADYPSDLDGDGANENETTDIFKTVILSNEYKTVTFDTSQTGNGINFPNNMVAFDSRGLPRNNTGGFAGGTAFLINTTNNKARSVTVSSTGAVSIAEYP
ncbi:MAG: GspH/FimT family pseudopilin [Deltaproteobacteria bacterium]|nr:GspH/FimT family pseudopilin [Deltaproteobacteria bacterium]